MLSLSCHRRGRPRASLLHRFIACLSAAGILATGAPAIAAQAVLPADPDSRLMTCVAAVLLTEMGKSPDHRVSFAGVTLAAEFTLRWTLKRPTDHQTELREALTPTVMQVKASGAAAETETACISAYPDVASNATVKLPGDRDDQLIGCAALAAVAVGQFRGAARGTPYPEAAPYAAFLDRVTAHSSAIEATYKRKRQSWEDSSYRKSAMDMLALGRLTKVLDACVAAFPENSPIWR
jgi:hypothetical protein